MCTSRVMRRRVGGFMALATAAGDILNRASDPADNLSSHKHLINLPTLYLLDTHL